MKITFRSVRSGCRLAVGGVLLPTAFRRGRRTKWNLISVDIFGTLLARIGGQEIAWHESALQAGEVARAHGLDPAGDPIALRRKVESRLGAELLATGRDPEFSHQQVFEEMLRSWGAAQWAEGEAAQLAHWELRRERRFTRPIDALVTAVREWAASGNRVVAISDSRYSAGELAWLLSSHDITGLSAIYSSADEGVSKFSGRLFDVVARRENVKSQQMLHIGDDLMADTLSAAERGWAIRRIVGQRNAEWLPLPPQQPTHCADPAFQVGYQTFGPVLVAFSRLLIHHARQDGIRRLLFVARDGDLLMRVTQSVLRAHETSCRDTPSLDDHGRISLNYLHLSRRSLACASPDLQQLGSDVDCVERVIRTLRSIRSMGSVGSVLESFRDYYNAPTEILMHHVKRLQIENGTETEVRRLLRDENAGADLAQAFRLMRERVRKYLLQEGVLREHSALVDIGWRGSLQKLLVSEKDENVPGPRGYYFGLWNEDSRSFPEDATGLITDQRRGRGLFEGSAWHAAFLLEAVCRASHGTVTGFIDCEGGRIEPTHIEDGIARDSERKSERTQIRIQNGALAYAEWYSRTYPITITDEVALRRAVQRRMCRLAFFPTEHEREMGHLLVHSEPTSDGSALQLIASSGIGLRGWIAGLRSPWKGGYLRANGGVIASGICCAVEGIVSQLPSGTKPVIRRLLIRD